jgi:hypothetical protein
MEEIKSLRVKRVGRGEFQLIVDEITKTDKGKVTHKEVRVGQPSSYEVVVGRMRQESYYLFPPT